MDEIHEVTGMKLAELRDVTSKRKQRGRVVKTVARAQKVDSTSQAKVCKMVTCNFFLHATQDCITITILVQTNKSGQTTTIEYDKMKVMK